MWSVLSKTMQRWPAKAVLLKCFSLFGGVGLYHKAQLRFGGLKDFHPSCRSRYSAILQKDLAPFMSIEGASLVEVGTGWVPVVPIGLYLLGAGKTCTFDINSHLQPDLIIRTLPAFIECIDELHEISGVPRAHILKRYNAIREIKDVGRLFDACGIVYHSPADIVESGLRQKSVDIFYSNLVLEHVPENAISGIMREAFRILKDDGACWHNVDCSDHYSPRDGRISAINFLKYSKRWWDLLGQNSFIYQNRMRMSQYLEIFEKCGFFTHITQNSVSDDVFKMLKAGFPLAAEFSRFTPDDIATTGFSVVLKKKPQYFQAIESPDQEDC